MTSADSAVGSSLYAAYGLLCQVREHAQATHAANKNALYEAEQAADVSKEMLEDAEQAVLSLVRVAQAMGIVLDKRGAR